MSTSAATHPTMLDYSNRVDADGQVAEATEIARESNMLLDHLPWIKCNDGSRHKTTMRTGVATPAWAGYYQGKQPSKSTTRSIYASTGILKDYSEVDADLVEQNGNSADFLKSEHVPTIDGLNEEFMASFFYGGGKNAFPGLASFYSDLSAENARNIIFHDADGNGVPDGTPNTSFWVLGLGPHGLHGIYPDGFPMGIQVDHKGKVTLDDADGNDGGRLEIWRSYYRWACGFALRNWQTCARVQVDYSALTRDASSGANLHDELSRALARTKRGKSIKKVIVANEGVLEMFRLQAKHAVTNSTLTREELHGRDVDHIDGMPVLLTDALHYNEDPVS